MESSFFCCLPLQFDQPPWSSSRKTFPTALGEPQSDSRGATIIWKRLKLWAAHKQSIQLCIYFTHQKFKKPHMMNHTDLSDMASCWEISLLCVDKFQPPQANISASHILLVSHSKCSSNAIIIILTSRGDYDYCRVPGTRQLSPLEVG